MRRGTVSRASPGYSTFEPFASWANLDLGNLDGEAPFYQEFVDRYSWFVADQSSCTRLLFGEPNEPTET
jgi:hypothetical protein